MEENPKFSKFLKNFAVLIIPITIVIVFGLVKIPAIKSLGAFLAQNVMIKGIGNFLVTLAEQMSEVEEGPIVFVKPEIVKSVYLTSWSAGTKSRIDYAINLAKTTEINAVVIDIKDFSGYVAYDTDDTIAPKIKEYNAKKIKIADVESLIKKLHKAGVYAIARIAVFQDPVLAWARPDLAILSKSKLASLGAEAPYLSPVFLWLDNAKLAWIDPAAKEAWDYNIAVAKDALGRGFDEINFDYVRSPTGGNLKNMSYPLWDGITPKHLIIKEFFKKVREELPEATLSVDLFGLVTINQDDLGVGQVIEDAFEYFDYICPMLYPSHYANGFLGYQNPALYPYQVVKYSMENAQERLKIYQAQKSSTERKAYLRPWLQDFNMGATYNSRMVKLEIDAVLDTLAGNDFKGFMLWNPSNYYTSGALQSE